MNSPIGLVLFALVCYAWGAYVGYTSGLEDGQKRKKENE